jgi:threonylcarbamoyladenosine tRNA methylthiotransferase MtaB
VVVTGCYSETQPEKLEKMSEVDLVVGNPGKKSIPLIMDMLHQRRAGRSVIGSVAPGDEMMITHFLGHSRAFIKIQEGCNASCSYCIIPRARGVSRSIPPIKVIDQVKLLEENGYQEIVLTGIHIGRYGMDLEGRNSLTSLMAKILRATRSVRIRLSSIEVNEVTSRLIELISGSDRVASHLHIPVQSGDDQILRAMNRPYRADQFRKRVERVIAACGRIAIGTDLIVGFPGETEAHFRNTYRLVSETPISYVHVFSFSRRPNTSACGMDHQVRSEIKKRRSAKLIRLGKSKKRAFMKSCIGTEEPCLVQGPKHQFSRFMGSLSSTYNEVFVKRSKDLCGKLVPVQITHYSRGRLYGNVRAGACSSGADVGEAR